MAWEACLSASIFIMLADTRVAVNFADHTSQD